MIKLNCKTIEHVYIHHMFIYTNSEEPVMEKVLILLLLLSLLPPLPSILHRPQVISGEDVNVYSRYTSDPAPTGIADYGMGPNRPYVTNTTQFLCLSP